MPIQIPMQFQKLKEKNSSNLKDKIFQKAGEVSAKIPSVNLVKENTLNVTKKAVEITRDGLKDGIKKSATKVAGIGVAGAATSAVGTFAVTGIGSAIVATSAGAAILTAGVPIVAGITTTCILDRVVKAVFEDDKSNGDDNHIQPED